METYATKYSTTQQRWIDTIKEMENVDILKIIQGQGSEVIIKCVNKDNPDYSVHMNYVVGKLGAAKVNFIYPDSTSTTLKFNVKKLLGGR